MGFYNVTLIEGFIPSPCNGVQEPLLLFLSRVAIIHFNVDKEQRYIRTTVLPLIAIAGCDTNAPSVGTEIQWIPAPHSTFLFVFTLPMWYFNSKESLHGFSLTKITVLLELTQTRGLICVYVLLQCMTQQNNSGAPISCMQSRQKLSAYSEPSIIQRQKSSINHV